MMSLFGCYHLKVFIKAMFALGLVLFNIVVNSCLAFEVKLIEEVANTSRLGQVIKKTDLLKQPSYQSESAGYVAAKEKINIQKRKSAWYLISTENIAQKGQVTGWVSMLNVRFIATAKREGELGVGSLFSSAINDSLPTVSSGVRGFDEKDLKNAKADLKQLLLLNAYVVSTGAAARFAQQGKLQANKIKVKED